MNDPHSLVTLGVSGVAWSCHLRIQLWLTEERKQTKVTRQLSDQPKGWRSGSGREQEPQAGPQEALEQGRGLWPWPPLPLGPPCGLCAPQCPSTVDQWLTSLRIGVSGGADCWRLCHPLQVPGKMEGV